MLRFCEKEFVKPEGMKIVIAKEDVCLNKDIWQNGQIYFRNHFCTEVTMIHLLPVTDQGGEVLCYGWQDNEANRELRMLKELVQSRKVLQFSDIFPKISEVVVCGCNELAYYFVKYLEMLRIKVSVIGKYWNYMGYTTLSDDEVCSRDAMIIHAEVFFQSVELYQRMVRSVSSEFECINKIYVANVLAGKIKDANEDFKRLLMKLKNKTVVVLGTTPKAQDTYDMLYSYGVDIVAFAEKCGNGSGKNENRILLGKRVINIGYAVSQMREAVFIGCEGKHSALGTEQTEIFDYYGYERGRQFLLIDDYMDVPYSNLVHVLRGRKVLLAGDVVLCEILREYLEQIEDNDIVIKHIELCQYNDGDEGILCIVHPWCGAPDVAWNPRLYRLRMMMKEAGHISYTEYFSRTRAFSIINQYLKRDLKKYTIKQLVPKGILLGEIPTASGNFLVEGIMDGHPNVLMLPHSDWNSNLFLYCICLAHKKSEEIIDEFSNMVDEGDYRKSVICDWDSFGKSVEELLCMKEQFTSQELFMIFHIAYAEMMSGRKITNFCEKVIYWEPHYFNRMDFPFLANWLESPDINGYSLVMRRDGIISCGSRYKLSGQYNNLDTFNYVVSVDYLLVGNVSERVSCQYWKELRMRFEDLKLHPKKELSRICKAIGIQMSDTMLHTTMNGKEWVYGGVKDFDLKPVFNKYEEYFSEFDRFRLSILNSLYQKKYGYVYEDCTKFSRKELSEMFLKEFRFQSEIQFADKTEKTGYFLSVYEIMRQQLWNVRKHMLLKDIVPVFDPVEI